MNLWAKFIQAIPHRPTQLWLFRWEAILTLLYAQILVRVLPFTLLEGIMNRKLSLPEILGTQRQKTIQGVRWAIHQAELALPFKIVCFPRSLAAQIILRRYGVYTTLYYGAATLPEKGLTAHTWIQDKAIGIVDHENAGDYQILACYPKI